MCNLEIVLGLSQSRVTSRGVCVFSLVVMLSIVHWSAINKEEGAAFSYICSGG